MRWTRLVLRNLRQRPGRAAVSVASVAIGVAVFLSMSIATRDVRETITKSTRPGIFEQTVNLSPLGVFDSYAPRAALDRVKALPDVTGVIGAIAGQSVLVVDGERRSISLGGWDSNGVTTGRMPAPGAAEVAVGEGLAALGATVRIEPLGGGSHDAVVTGIIDAGNRPADFALTTRQTMSSWLGVGDVVNYAVVQIADGVDPKQWIEEHEQELGPFQEQTGFFDSDAVEFFRMIGDSLAPLAASSLIVAGYLIFLTLGRAVQDRSRTLATLRALGTSRRQLVGLILGEAAVVGAVGTGAGLALGSVLSVGVTTAMQQMFGVEVLSDGRVSLPPSTFAIAIALGMLAPLLAATFPALLAARTDPAANLRGSTPTPSPASLPRLVAGAAMFAAGAGATAVAPATLKAMTGLLALGGAVVALPIVGRPIGAAAARAWARVRPGPGELAAQELARRPGRSAQTTALVSTILMVAVLVATIAASQRPSLVHALNAHYGADANVVGGSAGLTDAQLAALAADPDVEAMSPGASGIVNVTDPGGRAESLRVIDPATYFDVAGIPWAVGTDGDEAINALRRGEVLLATAIARRVDAEVGDVVHLQTTTGIAPFRVGGLFSGLGYGETIAVTVSMDVARASFGLDRTPFVRVDLRDGVDVDTWADAHDGLQVQPFAELRASILRSSDGIANMAYVLLVMTVLVGVMGLANTLAMDTLDRRREVGVLRALGLQRREVRSTVLTHAVLLTAVAGVLAVVLGSVLGAAFVADGGRTSSLTMPTTYAFPFRTVPVIVLAALVVGAIAGVTPARIAARLDPTEALRLPVEG